MFKMVRNSASPGTVLPVQSPCRGYPAVWQQLCQCCSRGEFFPPSLPFSKCPSTVQALPLADRDCCLQGKHLFLYQTGWFFLLYLNTTVLSWYVVHSEAPAGVMLTAGSGSLSCELLPFAHQHFIRDFGFFSGQS